MKISKIIGYSVLVGGLLHAVHVEAMKNEDDAPVGPAGSTSAPRAQVDFEKVIRILPYHLGDKDAPLKWRSALVALLLVKCEGFRQEDSALSAFITEQPGPPLNLQLARIALTTSYAALRPELQAEAAQIYAELTATGALSLGEYVSSRVGNLSEQTGGTPIRSRDPSLMGVIRVCRDLFLGRNASSSSHRDAAASSAAASAAVTSTTTTTTTTASASSAAAASRPQVNFMDVVEGLPQLHLGRTLQDIAQWRRACVALMTVSDERADSGLGRALFDLIERGDASRLSLIQNHYDRTRTFIRGAFNKLPEESKLAVQEIYANLSATPSTENLIASLHARLRRITGEEASASGDTSQRPAYTQSMRFSATSDPATLREPLSVMELMDRCKAAAVMNASVQASEAAWPRTATSSATAPLAPLPPAEVSAEVSAAAGAQQHGAVNMPLLPSLYLPNPPEAVAGAPRGPAPTWDIDAALRAPVAPLQGSASFFGAIGVPVGTSNPAPSGSASAGAFVNMPEASQPLAGGLVPAVRVTPRDPLQAQPAASSSAAAAAAPVLPARGTPLPQGSASFFGPVGVAASFSYPMNSASSWLPDQERGRGPVTLSAAHMAAQSQQPGMPPQTWSGGQNPASYSGPSYPSEKGHR